MGLISRLDLDKVTFGDLYRFADHARAASIADDEVVTVETTDAVGNPMDTHVLVADLGDVDEVHRPVLIDRDDATDYFHALNSMLAGDDTETDRKLATRLLEDLAELPHDNEGERAADG